MAMDLQIGDKFIGPGHPTFFIAEVASAHEGNIDVAKQMIDIAKEANADAVKFQIVDKDEHMVPYHETYPILQKLVFTDDQWNDLRQYAREKNIPFIADAYDAPSAELISRLDVDAVKIHSADLTNPELIEQVAQLHKPTFLGVGATTMDEISQAIAIIRKYHNNIILMHGFQAFPTKLEDMHFNYIKTLKTAFNLPVGILDHTEGETFISKVIPLLTPFVGASAIEKHFTVNRSLKGIDYESSVNPNTLKEIVQHLREIETTLGSSTPPATFSPAEQRYRDWMKKTIVAQVNIPEGTIITRDHIAFKRAGKGLRPMDAHKILGKQAKTDIQQHQNITEEHVQ
jgi:sialic acid synthase SpsE